jgi:hypothetical protein
MYVSLLIVARVLGVDSCWFLDGDFHFRLAGDWTVSIRPESANRLRVETWHALRRRDTKWVASTDVKRLVRLVRDARETALQPA